MIKRKRKMKLLRMSVVFRNGCLALTAILIIRLLYSFGIMDMTNELLKKAGQDSDFIRKTLSLELNSKFNTSEDHYDLQDAFSSPSAYLDFDSETQLLQESAIETEEDENSPLISLNYVPVSLPETIESNSTSPEDDDPGAATEITLTPNSTSGYLYYNGIYIKNQTNYTVDIEQLYNSELTFSDVSGPKVLIVHTHGSEAYHPAGNDIYTESDPRRTEDSNYNMLRIGTELAEVFESHGIEVLHSSTLHDYPSYSGSYSRSLETVEEYLSMYPSIELVIDLHRDSLADADGTEYKTVVDIDGKRTAQVMFVVGTDEGGLSHPDWQENLSLAIKLQDALEKQYPSFARPISLRSSRFNQHMTSGSLLVEVGCSGNTLQEALRAIRIFGESTAQALIDIGL